MRIMNFIKNYPCTIIFTIILVSGVTTLLITAKASAQTTKSENIRCYCTQIKLCQFDYYFDENGMYQCNPNGCKCSGPARFIHCRYPEAEDCTYVGSGGCSCYEDKNCVASDCNNACNPMRCVDCYQYDLHPGECYYEDWLTCSICMYMWSKMKDY